KYAFLGLDTRYNPTREFVDLTARGSIVRYASELNPFVYSLSASLGARRSTHGGGSGLFGLGFDFSLPLGLRSGLGFTPAEVRVAFGGTSTGSEIVTRLLRFDYGLSDRLFLTVQGPLE